MCIAKKTPTTILNWHSIYANTFTIEANDNIIPYDDDVEDNDNKPVTIQAAQRQINTILAGHATCTPCSIKAFTNQA